MCVLAQMPLAMLKLATIIIASQLTRFYRSPLSSVRIEQRINGFYALP